MSTSERIIIRKIKRYSLMAILVKVNEAGRTQKSKFIIIPKQIIKELEWGAGDRLYFSESMDGIEIRRINDKNCENERVRRLRFNGYSYAITIPKVIAKGIQADWLELKKSGNKIVIKPTHRISPSY